MGKRTETRTWATPLGLVVFGWVLLVATIAWFILAEQPVDRLFIGVIALALLAVTGHASRCRPQLQADSTGITLRGLRGPQHYPWSEITVRGQQHRRFGRTAHTLELETRDERLIVLGRFELGTDPYEVSTELAQLRDQTAP